MDCNISYSCCYKYRLIERLCSGSNLFFEYPSIKFLSKAKTRFCLAPPLSVVVQMRLPC